MPEYHIPDLLHESLDEVRQPSLSSTHHSPFKPLPRKPKTRTMRPGARIIPILRLPQLEPGEQRIKVFPIERGVHPGRAERDGRDGSVGWDVRWVDVAGEL